MKSVFILLSIVLSLCLSAKELISTQEGLDAAFIFLISKNTSWENNNRSKYFNIAVVDKSDRTVKAFEKLTKGIKLNDKPIKINRIDFSDIDDVYQNYQVLFLSKRYKKRLSDVFEVIPESFPILIISKECNSDKDFMINLYEDNFQKINIQINLDQIHKHNLLVSNEIILAGGKKVGISNLFESSIEALKVQEKKYKEYALKNQQLKQEIRKYRDNIDELEYKMKTLRSEISLRQNELENKLSNIRKKNRELDKIVKALKSEKQQLLKKQAKLKSLKNEYVALRDKLNAQKELMQKQKDIISKKESVVLQKQQEIKILDKQIHKQQQQLVDKIETIQQQSMVLYLMIVIVSMMILFAIYFYRSKKRYEQLNEQLGIAKENADNANHSKSIFLANMSHELRTPLNAILGFSQLLTKDDTISKSNKKTIHSIYRAGSFLLSLINDVLDISRIEAGKLVLHEDATDIKQMLGDIFSFVKTAAEKEGIKLLMKIDESVPECVFLDGDKLRQIILNYLTNSIKYSGGKTVNLYIKSSKKTLYISVKDEGQGIKKEDMENIFKPFIQIDKANEHTGTGLGLTITQKYAQSMGGDVSVESEYNRGSVFKAYVSYASCHLDEIDKREILHNINGIKTQKLIKILIVDDKLDNRELLANILKNDGFEIFMAENGQEAVEEFKKHTPDIIWMDRKMPLLDGEEATKIIRTLPKGRDVVIIGITASAFKEDEEKLLSAGMDEFILKPYDIGEIFMVMKKYFDVEYIYEKSPKTEDELPHEFSYEQFVAELKTLDDDTLKSLYHNTLLLDKEVIQTSIKDIEKENKDLADMLNYLVEEMLYNVIIKNVSEIVET